MATINSITPELTADWDLQLGSDGSLKMLSGTAAIAQNVACAVAFAAGAFSFRTTASTGSVTRLRKNFSGRSLLPE